MVFAVADVAISSSCYSASLIVSFYRTVTCGLDIFNHTRTSASCQNTSTTIIIALHLRIVESDVLDAAISSIAKETNFIRGGADEEVTDRLPVAIECTLILIIELPIGVQLSSATCFSASALWHTLLISIASTSSAIFAQALTLPSFT